MDQFVSRRPIEFAGPVTAHSNDLGLLLDIIAEEANVVERIYIDKLKQVTEKAKYFAAAGTSVFRPLDDDLIRREQRIADTLFQSGDIRGKIDVDIEFGRRFNPATVQAA